MTEKVSNFLKVIAVAAGYFALGKLSMTVAVAIGGISPLWPAAGLALACLLKYGKGIWPGILLGALLACYVPGVPLWITLTSAVGNTATSVFAYYLIQRHCHTNQLFGQVRDVLKLAVIGVFIGPILDTTIGVGSLYLGGVIPGYSLPFALFAWWVGEAAGVVVITPLILTWLDRKEKWQRPVEFIILVLMAVGTSQLIFSGWIAGSLVKSLNLKFLLLPYYVWLVFRFGPRQIATTTLLVEVVAFGNTLFMFGTVTGMSINELLLSLEAFVSFIMIAALVLNAMVSERKRMIEDLARVEKLNLIGEMAAGVAHEIRNPMTTVRGFLQMLSAKQELQQLEFFDLMINELDRANAIISEYLMLARNKPGELRVQSLNQVIKALQPMIVADALNSDKEVEVVLSEVPDLPMDEKEIRQLILNFVRNGLEAMSQGGMLIIKTFVEKNRVVLAFQDEGTGIDPQIFKNLGTPFVTTKENGTGLGLAVSYSIAARHNAVIEADTCPSGTTFYIKFKLTS